MRIAAASLLAALTLASTPAAHADISFDAARGCVYAVPGENSFDVGAIYNTQVGDDACTYTAVAPGGYAALGSFNVVVLHPNGTFAFYSDRFGSPPCQPGVIRIGDRVLINGDPAVIAADAIVIC